LIRLLSSSLPREAIEVAVCSKYSLEAIALTFENYYLKVGSALVLIVPGVELLSQEVLCCGPNIKISSL